MLWFYLIVSCLLAVWGYFLFREQEEVRVAAVELVVPESEFDRFRRMRELTQTHHQEIAPQIGQAEVASSVAILTMLQEDAWAAVLRWVEFCNQNKDRYWWFLATSALIVMMLFHVGTQVEEAPETTAVPGWEAMEPLRGERLHNDAVAKQVESKEVFQILFRDFPRDRARFIHEFTTVLGSAPSVQRDKWLEMYVVMGIHHMRRYVAKTPDAEMLAYANGLFATLQALLEKGDDSCYDYMRNSADFKAARAAVGSEKFNERVRTIPALIVAATKTPQSLPNAARAEQALRVVNQRVKENRFAYMPGNHQCRSLLAYYDEVLKLPADEASLVLRYNLSK